MLGVGHSKSAIAAAGELFHPWRDLPRAAHVVVFFESKWAAVPDDAVILGPNKFGKAIVWFEAAGEYYERPNTTVLCFMPGSGV